MDTVGTFNMAKALANHKIITALHKHQVIDEVVKFYSDNATIAGDFVALSAGAGESDEAKVTEIIQKTGAIKMLCLDVANGYSENFVNTVRRYREKFTDLTILAGNVVTGEMTEELILSGADVVKVGIGPGSVCTTRKQTGVGYPQLSAVIECADAAHGLGGLIISDGGCTCPGDVAKAFGAGADFVMLGGMLAGHSECAGEVIERDGKQYQKFYGMSSDTAMKKYAGGVAEYRASEGKTVEVPFKGPVDHTILEILGGIRSTCTYVGASSLKELSKRTTFVRVTQQINNIF
jgi:GMP reductase